MSKIRLHSNANTRLYHSGGVSGLRQQLIDEVAQKLKALKRDQPERILVDAEERFIVVFETEQFAPTHQVTMRTDWDGWTKEIYGEFWFGAWFFELDPEVYPEEFQSRFALDGRISGGESIQIVAEPNVALVFFENNISFGNVTGKAKHGFDNLNSIPTYEQQQLCPSVVDESIEYDVIVVGSGMAGGTLADQLSDKNIKTLVLELGGLKYQTHIDNLPGHTFNFGSAERDQVGHYINKPDSESNLLFGTQMNLGGRSIYWEGLIPRMAHWEAKYWPDSVAKYLFKLNGYQRAEELVRNRTTLGPFQERLVRKLGSTFTKHIVGDLPRALHQPNMRVTGSLAQVDNVLVRSTGVFSTADLLLDSLSADRAFRKPYLTINLNHLVTHLETADGRVKAVVCKDLAGNKTRRYIGKQFVLCAGSLESPRIAMASKLSDPNKQFGVGLTDHPAFVMRDPVELKKSSSFWGTRNHAKVLMRHSDGFSHPYSIEVLVNPRYWDVRHSDDDVMKHAVGPSEKTYAFIKFLFDSPLDSDNRIRFRGPNTKLEVVVNHNRRGLPFANSVKDMRNRILSFLCAEFSETEDLDYHGNGTVHHAGGSLRMAGDDTGAVDHNLRFNGYENLYCCDVSVFPHIPTANPSLTLIALSQRLGDRIATQV